MKKRGNVLLGLMAAGALSVTAFSSLAASLPASAPTVSVTATTSDNQTTIYLARESYDELADTGIVPADTIKRMNEFAMQTNNQVHQEFLVTVDAEETAEFVFFDGLNPAFFEDDLTQMVQQGIITETEKNAIDTYYWNQTKQEITTELSHHTNRYVAEQIISAETAQQMLDYEIKQLTDTHLAANEGIFSLSIDEQLIESGKTTTSFSFGAYFDLDELLKQTIITKLQKEAIEASDHAYQQALER